MGSCHHSLGRAEAALEAAVECPEGAIRTDDRSRGLSESLPAMSQSSSPELLPFTPDASFQLCDPGSACLKPGKVSEDARFRPIMLALI
jgi:hypothetical protein